MANGVELEQEASLAGLRNRAGRCIRTQRGNMRKAYHSYSSGNGR
jgi:hypothetical protein